MPLTLSRPLLRLFANRAAGVGGRVTGASVAFRNGHAVGWVLVAMFAVTIAVVWSYRRTGSSLPPVRRRLMVACRTLLVAGVLLLLLEPILRLVVEHPVRPTVAVLVDASASMDLRDRRTTADDLKRARLLVPTTGPSRVELVRAALHDPKLDLLARLSKTADVRPYTFDKTTAELLAADWADHLTATGSATALGDAVGDVLTRGRGQPLAAVVVVTDGQANAGAAPAAAAAAAKAQGVPLLIYGVGVADAVDVAVVGVYAPNVAFVADAVPVTVRLRGTGLAGQTGRVVLTLGGKEVAAADVTYDGSEQAVALSFKPTTAGTSDLTATVAPRPDEAVTTNNSASSPFRVIDGKLRILLVESAPRWQFKYLQATLLRDPRVALKCLLTEADPGVAADPTGPYLPAFPPLADLTEHYDAVILGDVDPAALGPAADEIAKFVDTAGGGLVFVPGQRFDPAAWAAAPLAKLLPVDLSTVRPANGAMPTQPRLTPAGGRTAALRLADDPRQSAERWATLPPLYGVRPAAAKPGAEVLLTAAPATATAANADRAAALLAVGTYGAGPVAYVGADDTWRWRRNGGDAAFAAVWGQLAQRLALPHLTGSAGHARLAADRQSYDPGDRVTLDARATDGQLSPLTDPSITATITPDDGSDAKPVAVELKAVPDAPGAYRGDAVATVPGRFVARLDREPKAEARFAVTTATLELSRTALDVAGLREMAAASGGRFFREEDLRELPDAVRPKPEFARSSAEIDLWSSPTYFVVLLLLATVEWVLRKSVQLR